MKHRTCILHSFNQYKIGRFMDIGIYQTEFFRFQVVFLKELHQKQHLCGWIDKVDLSPSFQDRECAG